MNHKIVVEDTIIKHQGQHDPGWDNQMHDVHVGCSCCLLRILQQLQCHMMVAGPRHPMRVSRGTALVCSPGERNLHQ